MKKCYSFGKNIKKGWHFLFLGVVTVLKLMGMGWDPKIKSI